MWPDRAVLERTRTRRVAGHGTADSAIFFAGWIGRQQPAFCRQRALERAKQFTWANAHRPRAAIDIVHAADVTHREQQSGVSQ